MKEELTPYITVKVNYSDGDSQITQIRLSPEEAAEYYLGKNWSYWDTHSQSEKYRFCNSIEIGGKKIHCTYNPSVKNILKSLYDDIESDRITYRQAGVKLYRAGWFNFIPDEEIIKSLLKL